MSFVAAAVVGAGVVSQIAGGIASREASRGDAGKARDAANIAMAKLDEIGLPPDLAKKIVFEQFQQKGILTPELEEHINTGPSKMEEISEDPALKDAQMNALQILSKRGKGGFNPEDRAALNEVRNKIATDTEAKRQQILQNFQARGQAGGGAELIAALQGAQSGANEESLQGDRLAAMSSKNALEAISQAGTLGGQIRGQEFGQEAEKAKAQDVINQFNVANQVGQQARNVGAQNTAQASNLSTAQNISNANVQQANQELLRQKDAERQNWLDKMNRAQVQAGGRMAESNYLSGQAQQAGQSAAAPYQAIGAAATTVGGGMMKKKDSEFAEGGEVPEKSFADKFSDYFASKPAENQLPSEDARKSTENSMRKAFKFADGGEVQENTQYPGSEFSDEFEKLGESTLGGRLDASNQENPRELQNKQIVEQWRQKHGYSTPEADQMFQLLNQPTPTENPEILRLKKIFPSVSDENLTDIYQRANPQALSDGGAVRQPDEHQRRMPVTDFRSGGHVPGQAPVTGDSPKNDIIDAKLSPGEYVIKRTDAKSPFGKKLIKLLEAHHEVMRHDKNQD